MKIRHGRSSGVTRESRKTRGCLWTRQHRVGLILPTARCIWVHYARVCKAWVQVCCRIGWTIRKDRGGCSLSCRLPKTAHVTSRSWTAAHAGCHANAQLSSSIPPSSCSCVATLEQGGVTASIGDVEGALLAVKGSRTRVHVLIRPRPGDFVYSALEKQVSVCHAGRNIWNYRFSSHQWYRVASCGPDT